MTDKIYIEIIKIIKKDISMKKLLYQLGMSAWMILIHQLCIASHEPVRVSTSHETGRTESTSRKQRMLESTTKPQIIDIAQVRLEKQTPQSLVNMHAKPAERLSSPIKPYKEPAESIDFLLPEERAVEIPEQYLSSPAQIVTPSALLLSVIHELGPKDKVELFSEETSGRQRNQQSQDETTSTINYRDVVNKLEELKIKPTENNPLSAEDIARNKLIAQAQTLAVRADSSILSPRTQEYYAYIPARIASYFGEKLPSLTTQGSRQRIAQSVLLDILKAQEPEQIKMLGMPRLEAPENTITKQPRAKRRSSTAILDEMLSKKMEELKDVSAIEQLTTWWQSFAIEIALLPPTVLGSLIGAAKGLVNSSIIIFPAIAIAAVAPVAGTLAGLSAGGALGVRTGGKPVNISQAYNKIVNGEQRYSLAEPTRNSLESPAEWFHKTPSKKEPVSNAQAITAGTIGAITGATAGAIAGTATSAVAVATIPAAATAGTIIGSKQGAELGRQAGIDLGKSLQSIGSAAANKATATYKNIFNKRESINQENVPGQSSIISRELELYDNPETDTSYVAF